MASQIFDTSITREVDADNPQMAAELALYEIYHELCVKCQKMAVRVVSARGVAVEVVEYAPQVKRAAIEPDDDDDDEDNDDDEE